MSRKVEDTSVLSIETETINEKNKKDQKEIKKEEGDRDFLMVATTFIAAMAFQAGTNPPGGVWQDDDNPNHEAGKSIMATKSPSLFISFISGVTICFACSSMQFIVILVKSAGKTWSVSRSFLYFTMGSAISAMIVAYWSSVKALTPDSQMSHVIVMLKTTLVPSIGLLPISIYIEETTCVSLETMDSSHISLLSYYLLCLLWTFIKRSQDFAFETTQNAWR